MKLSFTLLGLLVAFHTYANNCHPHADHSLPLYDSGYLEVPLDYQNPDGERTKLYWEKFHGKDSNLTPVIFLSGGPAPHFLNHGPTVLQEGEMASPYFIKNLFNDRNFIMFDYRGFNCSDIIDSFDNLKGKEQFYDISTMANDVRSLKEFLYPNRKVALYGGSFGYVLGARVVNEHPEIVAGAMLGWGSMRGEMYYNALNVIDSLIDKMMTTHPGFKDNWQEINERIDRGELRFTIEAGGETEEVVVTQEMFQVINWLILSQNSTRQIVFPYNIADILKGDEETIEWYKMNIITYYGLIYAHANDYSLPLPSPISTITNYYRCNSYATDLRTTIKDNPLSLKYLDSNILVNFWDETCKQYDSLQPIYTNAYQQIKQNDVPILAWLGKLDSFNWKTSTQDLKALSTKADVHVFDDWSHDFGPRQAGVPVIKSLVENFLKQIDAENN